MSQNQSAAGMDRESGAGGGATPDRQERSHGSGFEVRDTRTEQDRRADEALGDGEGLPGDEARSRLQRYGPNSLREERESLFHEVAKHFWGPIPWMIEAALVLTAVTGRWVDFAIIMALLLLNGVVGFWEEHQAQDAIAALREQLARSAKVVRDGDWQTVPAEEVVPGDLVRVEHGQVVPADGRVVAGEGEADESSLTGESLPVPKGRGEPLFSGSAVSRGAPVLRVLATGGATQFGRTAELTGREAPPSHLQQAIVRIGKYLIVIAVALVAVIVVVSLARGAGWSQTLEFALVVTIASIPVALPAVLSVTLAVGARQLARHQAVVSHLPAVEEMAGVDVLCADKTGTITKNQLAVAEVAVLVENVGEDGVLLDAALTADPDSPDAIDQAIRARAGGGLEGWDVEGFEPFDPIRKYARATARGPGGQQRQVAKGAIQAIESLAGADQEVRQRLAQVEGRFADRGHRGLAVARTDGGDRWHIIGVLALQDPPREDSKDTLGEASRLGLVVKLVTGDRGEIARTIAGQVGLGGRILDAGAMEEGDEGLADQIDTADGYAQVVPEDKYRIVRALQGRGHIVGMTGDGVNDAPALRRADAGIAVSGATDAARAASDIVLLAPGLSAIIEAIYRSREVFQRMKNYSIFRITETIRVVVFVTATIVLFGFFPVTPIQVVLLAILNDAAILTIAYDRVRPSSRPERWDLSAVLTVAVVLGLVGVVSTFALVGVVHGSMGLDDPTVRTLIYLKLSVSGHLTVFIARTHGPFYSIRPASVLVAAVVGTQVIATVLALTGVLMQPIGWGLVALAWGWAAAEFVILDPVKRGTYQILERSGRAAYELEDPAATAAS